MRQQKCLILCSLCFLLFIISPTAASSLISGRNPVGIHHLFRTRMLKLNTSKHETKFSAGSKPRATSLFRSPNYDGWRVSQKAGANPVYVRIALREIARCPRGRHPLIHQSITFSAVSGGIFSGQIRNPKAEIRKKSELRTLKQRGFSRFASSRCLWTTVAWRFGFRVSSFFRPSDFGLRVSRFRHSIKNSEEPLMSIRGYRKRGAE